MYTLPGSWEWRSVNQRNTVIPCTHERFQITRGEELGLGPDKVRREIQLQPRLSHVNIVGLKQVCAVCVCVCVGSMCVLCVWTHLSHVHIVELKQVR